MPDISKCPGVDCPIKEKCWRFTSPDSGFLQSYIQFGPPGDDCEGFLVVYKKEAEECQNGTSDI